MSRPQNQKRENSSKGWPDGKDEYDLNLSHATRNTLGRRGQTSITHLLSYGSPYTDTYGDNDMANGRNRSATFRRNAYGKHRLYGFDKSRHISSNYRFILDPTSTSSSMDSNSSSVATVDQRVDWNAIQQVIVSDVSQKAQCPICLSDPVAPRMVQCGHIFCLPCLIHYLHIPDSEEEERLRASKVRNFGKGEKSTLISDPNFTRRSKRCPICDDSILFKSSRPVRFYSVSENPIPNSGEILHLHLMTRPTHSTIAQPVGTLIGSPSLKSPHSSSNDLFPTIPTAFDEKAIEKQPSEDGNSLPWFFAPATLEYARLMKGTSWYMMDQFDQEIRYLIEQSKTDQLLYSTSWEEDSKTSIERDRAKGLEDEILSLSDEWTRKAIWTIRDMQEQLYKIPRSAEPPCDVLSNSSREQSSLNLNDNNRYFFYEAQPHIYLSPLDIRILKTQYGLFSSFPVSISVRIQHISTGIAIDAELRKRAKYLSHLPIGCLIGLVECDWSTSVITTPSYNQVSSSINQSCVVSDEVLAQFSDELEHRGKKYKQKEALEEKQKWQAEQKERWNLQKLSGVPIHAESLMRNEKEMRTSDGLAREDMASNEWDALVNEQRNMTILDPEEFVPLANHTPSRSPPDIGPSTHSSAWATTSSTESYARAVVKQNDGWVDVPNKTEESSTNTGPEKNQKTNTKKKKKITLMSTATRRNA